MEYVVNLEEGVNSRVRMVPPPSDGSGSGNEGNTALHEAVIHNDVELVTVLLRKGADPSLKNEAGHTPVDIANQKLFTDIVRLFQRQQEEFLKWCEIGSPNDSDSLGYSKLMKACHLSDERAVGILLQKGADPRAATPHNSLTRNSPPLLLLHPSSSPPLLPPSPPLLLPAPACSSLISFLYIFSSLAKYPNLCSKMLSASDCGVQGEPYHCESAAGQGSRRQRQVRTREQAL